MTNSRSRYAGCARRTAETSPSPGSTSTSTGARSSRCSGRTAPARPPRWRSWRATGNRDDGEVRGARRRPRARPTRDWRARVGIVLQGTGEFDELTVAEVVHHFAGYYPNADDPDKVIARVGLADKRKARTHSLSGGQKRRLDVALGIIGRPELLFLDEPTTGFDPEARREFWELIRDLAGGRHHDPADHALPGRGRGAGRPGRRDQRRHGWSTSPPRRCSAAGRAPWRRCAGDARTGRRSRSRPTTPTAVRAASWPRSSAARCRG